MIEKPAIMIPSLGVPTDVFNGMLKQRDADAEYYETLIRDMYEALKRFLESSACKNNCDPDDMTCDTSFARKALAKAEGKNAK